MSKIGKITRSKNSEKIMQKRMVFFVFFCPEKSQADAVGDSETFPLLSAKTKVIHSLLGGGKLPKKVV